LIYNIYLASNPDNPFGEVEISSSILNIDNEEIIPQFGFNDVNL